MLHPLKYQVSKRRKEMCDFYYKGIGDRIKKKRLELKYTQETLAKGICSNTYVSKIENNKVIPNPEQLSLIMEKMDMNSEEIGMPDQIVEYLEKSLEYFFFKDIDNYSILFQKVSRLEFSSLVYIIRLGYYVLTEDYEDARIYYNEISRYYNSLEDYGFATFLIYGCFFNIGINDYRRARYVLDLVKGKLRNDEMLYALYSFLNYIVYGFLCLHSSAQMSLEIAKNIFIKEGNTRRNIEILMYMNIFRVFEGTNAEIKFNKNQFKYLFKEQKNLYLLVLAISKGCGMEYLEFMDKDSTNYSRTLFYKAIDFYHQKNELKFNEVKNLLIESLSDSKIKFSYLEILKYYETNNLTMVKEHLINYVLPYLIKTQNIYMIKLLSNELERIFSDKNRYKDALTYVKKCRSEILKLQTPLKT